MTGPAPRAAIARVEAKLDRLDAAMRLHWPACARCRAALSCGTWDPMERRLTQLTDRLLALRGCPAGRASSPTGGDER